MCCCPVCNGVVSRLDIGAIRVNDYDQWLVEEVTDQAMVREGGRGWGFRMLQNLKEQWCRNHW